jgi:hypothetical protein
MLDRADVEEVIYRVAVSAFRYYADKPTKELGYTVDEDVQWCAVPLAGYAEVDLNRLQQTIHQLITNPNADRQAFIHDLNARAG